MALDRREFLKRSAVVSGGLVIAIQLPGCGSKPAGPRELRTVETNAWLRIGTDNSITFLCDRSEMGQGVYTALPMLLAEELGVDVAKIRVEAAPAGDAYHNQLLGIQVTGGSTSVREAWDKLRIAGAQARTLLIAAAAGEWGITTAGCRTEDGYVVSPRGKRLAFGEVAEAAALMPAPENVALRERRDFRVIGKNIRRLDTPAKVDGSATFGIDVRLPGMLYAALAQPPVLKGSLRSFDDSRAKGMPGVVAVVPTSSGVAVVADSWWHAVKARDALRISWNPGPNASLDDARIAAGLRRAAPGKGKVARRDGDVEAALRTAARVVRADYELPLLAHATLEPQNCTARVTAEECEIWVPTQLQQGAQLTAAKAAGLEPAQVKVHTTFLGGGFGRRLEVDFIPAAVEAAKAVGQPVKLVWTREDDTTHDAYRPPAFDQVAAGFDAQGQLVAWKLHLVGPSVTARMFPGPETDTPDPFAIEAAANYPYAVPNVEVDFLRHEIGIDVGYWRSVSHALNAFVAESFMDELAAVAGKDPVSFRMDLLKEQPRYREVLRLATREAGYGSPRKGRFHGVALMEGYGTYMAQVAEISLEGGKLKVHKITCAIDCGQVVNPSIVIAQVESATVFGLTAALWGQVNVQGGQVRQKNFDTYRLMRIDEMPRIDTFIVDSGAPPGGVGEPATALVAPAVANALYMATSRRVRSLPFARHGFA
jgi:isoquinoline 1-oxidoreductase subunit beta